MKTLPAHEIKARLEAALYSAGRPLTIEELTQASGCGKERTISTIKEIMDQMSKVFTALEIRQLADKSYVLQIKPNYNPVVRKFAQQPLLSNSTLKTLSYITYEQPVTSKRLVQIRGSQAYSHVKELQKKGFVEYENLGRIKIYKTSKKFKEYFGIEDINSMKKNLVSSINKKI